MSDPFELGHGHIGEYTSYHPAGALNPVERYGLLIKHSTPSGNPCMGSVIFNSEAAKKAEPNKDYWDVQDWHSLTLSPSILCSCGDHGWIKEGRWVPA